MALMRPSTSGIRLRKIESAANHILAMLGRPERALAIGGRVRLGRYHASLDAGDVNLFEDDGDNLVDVFDDAIAFHGTTAEERALHVEHIQDVMRCGG